MPTDPRKRQKKQERKAAKRKSKQQELAREKNASLPERLASASRYPILDCWVTDNVWVEGLGWVCLSRELPNGSVGFGVFLLDRYCLGVKDAMYGISGRFAYDSKIRKMGRQFHAKDMDPACARKLVEGAVEYARGLGFQPHADYQRAKLIFGAIDASECKQEFEFGKDGKPYFIAGPHDSPERCDRIIRTLEQNCGPGGYNVLMPLGGGLDVFGPDEWGDEELEDIEGPDEPGEES